MQLTPTDKGAGIAGFAFATLAWFSLFKIDHLARMLHVDRWIKQDALFSWITRSYANQALTFLITEVINFGTHGVTNPASVIFACGSTIVNAFMIFIGLPLRMKAKREKTVVIMKSKAAAA